MILKPALPMLALALAACSQSPPPRALTALAAERQCPAYPLPPAALLKPPAKTDFLTGSSPQNRPSSSTN